MGENTGFAGSWTAAERKQGCLLTSLHESYDITKSHISVVLVVGFMGHKTLPPVSGATLQQFVQTQGLPPLKFLYYYWAVGFHCVKNQLQVTLNCGPVASWLASYVRLMLGTSEMYTLGIFASLGYISHDPSCWTKPLDMCLQKAPLNICRRLQEKERGQTSRRPQYMAFILVGHMLYKFELCDEQAECRAFLFSLFLFFLVSHLSSKLVPKMTYRHKTPCWQILERIKFTLVKDSAVTLERCVSNHLPPSSGTKTNLA